MRLWLTTEVISKVEHQRRYGNAFDKSYRHFDDNDNDDIATLRGNMEKRSPLRLAGKLAPPTDMAATQY